MRSDGNFKNPLAEIFGFPVINDSGDSKRYRREKLCPFNNRVPNCTKDKANNPLGVCSIFNDYKTVITCPVRFRESWLIVENAAKFFFPKGTSWTSLTEIRLTDANNHAAGNIDYVLVSYDNRGRLTDFASLEVQAVYISGNLRNPFEAYTKKPSKNFKWKTGFNYPKPDFLSSSRKRLLPQLLYKGGIFKAWGKKQSVVLQKSFFDTLPDLQKVKKEKADIAWHLYDLEFNKRTCRYNLSLKEIVYTEFEPALAKISTPLPGTEKGFIELLQERLDEKLESNPPDAPTLTDLLEE
ncbi:MAG: hypothetical protein HY884_02065 [Deltaproteobacteria bacterium]|nr:hypothetical protein [Deltaproteobacteria bacterium]